MAQVIKVPDVNFAGFYYPDILKELLTALRRNRAALGLTDENEYEVHVQLCRAFSYVGHLNNCRLDLLAQELLVDSLKLLESLKRLMKLIGVTLSSASPATSELVARLSEVTTADQVGFVPELSEFSTESVPPITFEVLEEGGIDLDRTDRATYVYGCEQVASGTCAVSAIAPDVIEKTGGATPFAEAHLYNHILIPEGVASNGGEYRIIQVVDATHVRVARVPGGESPAFQDESGLPWTMVEFTDDLATKNYTPGQTYQPWTDPVAGDCLYVGHPQVMPGQIDVDVTVGGANFSGVWEYYDDQLSKFPPTAVVDNGDGTLTFNLSSLLGTVDRHGASVVVEYIPTGAKERLVSAWACGINRVVTEGLLGQVVPSTDVEDYSITSTWVPFENQDDTSNDLSADGTVTFNMPQTTERNWRETEVNAVTGRWLRYRIVNTTGGITVPTIEEISIDGADQFIAFLSTQGETVGPQIIGSSDGRPNQTFALPETPFLDASDEVDVDESGTGVWVPWTRVENFLTSSATSRHYMIETDAKDKASIIFGDGTNGKVPPTGTDNVRATYRVGGDEDGNVGADEVTSNTDGVNGIGEVTNPRAAWGWRMKDGGTEQDIERIKRDAPAGLRTRDTASTPKDVELLAVRWTDTDGTRPVARAVAVEEGLGPKTIKLLVVGVGGTTLITEQKKRLESYFNGDRYSAPPVRGVLLLNHQVTVFNYEPLVTTIEALVTWPGGNVEAVRNALLALLTPLAVEDDGVTATWDFNGWVSRSRIYSEIHDVDPAVTDVPTLKINGVETSLRLGRNQLPIAAASTITVNVQASNL